MDDFRDVHLHSQTSMANVSIATLNRCCALYFFCVDTKYNIEHLLIFISSINKNDIKYLFIYLFK